MDLDHTLADRAAPTARRTRTPALAAQPEAAAASAAPLTEAAASLVALPGPAATEAPLTEAAASLAALPGPAATAAPPSAAPLSAASAVRCHIAFAGATRSFTIAPSAHTTAPEPLLHGASFVLEVLNRLPPEPGAGFKVRTLGTWGGQPVLLHQAWFLHTGASGVHGFTGLQVVREPARGHELSFWCERAPAQ